jgi:hypothetical protein
VKTQIELLAKVSGRSVSEELEYRVERSIEDQRLTILALGGPKSQGLVDPLLHLLDLLDRRGMYWTTDSAVARGVQKAFPILMETVLHPPLALARQEEVLAEVRDADEPKETVRTMELFMLLLQMLGLAQEPRTPDWNTKLQPGNADRESMP